VRHAENVLVALKRLRHRPVRSLLLLQGTIWGVAVALFPPAVLGGTRDAALARAPEIGADRITITSDPTSLDSTPIVAEDVAAVREAVIAKGIPLVAVAGMYVRGAPMIAGAKGPVDVVLGPPDAFAARGLALRAGRTFDPAAKTPETVLEGVLAVEIEAARGRVLGETVDLGDGLRATVVGTLAPRSAKARRTNDMGLDTEHPVYLSTVQPFLLQVGVPWGDDGWKRTDRCAYVAAVEPRVDWMYLRVPAVDTREASKVAGDALLARGRAPLSFYPPVYPILLADELDKYRTLSLALFLACLVMGGVVMANVGLLAALRRAPEIAVHRVEGALRSDITAQFLTEGAVLSVVGIVLGCVLACGIASIRVSLEPTSGVDWTFPWPEAGFAAVTAFVLGVGACVLPALRAAGQDPVEGLVDE
jgi:hypothetical protein